MDGGGRLLRSLGALFPSIGGPAPFALAGTGNPFALSGVSRNAPRLPHRLWRRHRRLRSVLARLAASRFATAGLIVGLLAGASGYGFVRGGRYAAFVAEQGTLPDVAARAAGFAIHAVTVTGARGLSEAEVLGLAGIGPRNSLLFLNVADIRSRLKAVPLIKEASVSKLYPNRLLIEIEERQPSALWQRNGAVSIVAGDGTPIDDIKDRRFESLPLVVGEGANEHLADYLAILDAVGELRERVRAGLFVAGRRWTLKMDNNIEVELPERAPAEAASRFAALEHDGHVLEKDVVVLDLRVPGRMAARLTAEAAAARAEAQARKTKKKGAAT